MRSPRVKQEITLDSECAVNPALTRSELNTYQIGNVEITDPEGNVRVTGIYNLESLTLGEKRVTGDQLRAAQALAVQGIEPTTALSYVTEGMPVHYSGGGYVHSTKCSPRGHNVIAPDSERATNPAETRNVLCAYGGRAGWKWLAALVLGGVAVLLSGCGGGGDGGGNTPTPHTPNSPTNTKPSINVVEFSPYNPLVAEHFTAKIDASDDTTPASDLKYEIIIDEDKKGAFDDAAVTGIGTTLPVTLHFSPNAVNGTYKVKVIITDAAGIQNNREYTITTSPHKFLKDGTVVENASCLYDGISLAHARAYFNNLGFSNNVADLDTILANLSSTERLTKFDFDTNSKMIEIFVNDSGQTNYADNDNDKQGDWAGGTEVEPLTASDLNDYLTQTIDPTTAISHAGYYFNLNPNSPDAPVSNNYASGAKPANPDVSKVYAHSSRTVLPGVGTISADLVVEYVTGLTQIIVVNPSPSDKFLIDRFKKGASYDPATFRVDELEGANATRAALDNILYEK